MLIRTAEKAQNWLKKNNYPYTDDILLQKSSMEFPEGGHYAVEIPVINSMDVLSKTIKYLKEYDVECTRFNETKGSFLLPDSEIKEMLHICAENNYGMVFALSPRPEYDIKASFYRSEFGMEQARKLNNNDAISYSVEEALRLAELGCRGIIVYDIGVLSILNQMRAQGLLPKDLYFKASSHCMATNPVIAKILHENGADSITTMHDLSLPVLQEMRRFVPGVVLDIPIDVYKTKGAYIRFNEIAEILQVSSPVILKMGASAQDHPYDAVNDDTIKNRVKRVKVGLEHLYRCQLELKEIHPTSKYRCLPKFKE